MKPIITERISGYVFDWPGVSILASNIKSHRSDGRITGEIEIYLVDKEGEKTTVSPPSDFNFKSEQTRSKWERSLSSKKDDIAWSQILDQLCYGVVKRTRKGEPLKELWTYEDVPPMEYVLEPVIVKGVPTVMFGEKGVAKSTLALVFYICLTLPWRDNPLGLKAPDQSIKTLILDYELPGYIAQRNAKSFQEGMGLPPIPLYHRKCTSSLADEIEQVGSMIEDIGAEVVIIDSLARACGGDLIKTEYANAFFEALDRLKVTALIIAQTSKDSDSKKKTIYGNALFTYYARSIFEVVKSEYTYGNEISVGLFHRWSNLTRLNNEMGFKISFNDKGTSIERQELSYGEFTEKIDRHKAIIDSLKTGEASVKEISDITGISESSCRVCLSRLKKKEQVVNPSQGKWGLKWQSIT